MRSHSPWSLFLRNEEIYQEEKQFWMCKPCYMNSQPVYWGVRLSAQKNNIRHTFIKQKAMVRILQCGYKRSSTELSVQNEAG